jgi:hypothetical protein
LDKIAQKLKFIQIKTINCFWKNRNRNSFLCFASGPAERIGPPNTVALRPIRPTAAPLASRFPRPGRNLGLGRESAAPPGPKGGPKSRRNHDRPDQSDGRPVRSREQKPVAAVSWENPNLILSISFSLSFPTSAEAMAVPEEKMAPPCAPSPVRMLASG